MLSSLRGAAVARRIALDAWARVTHEDGFSSEGPGCEGGCDDINPCTADACSGNVCTHLPRAGAACSDGDACTSADACDPSGRCVGGALVEVDDRNPCTTDSCDAVAGVTHAPLPSGTSCSNDNLCDGEERCDGVGACRAGVAPVVDDEHACTADACDPVLGVFHLPLPAGESCADASVCNGEEVCDGAGGCLLGAALPLDDANSCTQDTCSEASGVTHTALAAGTSCADANACNGDETCSAAGVCTAGAPPPLDDANPCTADSCGAGGVVHALLAEGTACDDGNVCNGISRCTASGVCAAGEAPPLDDGESCTSDSCDPQSGPVHTPISGCVREPSLHAPALDLTRETPFDERIAFLWSGPDAVQTSTAANVFARERVSLVRGRVLDVTLAPLAGVRVRIAHHPEYGETRTRQDGVFDIAFNGGGRLTLAFEREGALRSERDVTTRWNEATTLNDVVLIAADAVVSPLAFGAGGYQLASGSLVSDGDGTRRASALFAPETHAAALLPDGSRVALDSASLRISEYTVGEAGGRAMPAPLPANVAYTYCVEMQLDEAAALGADTVEFDRPVSVYYENFLRMPVGSGVPVGSYDRAQSRWVGSPDGFVLRLVSENPAALDITGDSVADAEDERLLALIGLDASEARQIASRFSAGESFVRLQVTHFSPIDANYVYIINPPPLDVPDNPPAAKPSDPNPCVQNGSRIECQNQFLGEHIPLQGVPSDLYYASDRTAGFVDAYHLEIPVGGLRNTSSRLHVSVRVGGKALVLERNAPQSRYSQMQLLGFSWDGKDTYGRRLQGAHAAEVSIRYEPPYRYVPTSGIASRAPSGGSGGSFAVATPNFGVALNSVLDVVANARARVMEEGGLSLEQRYTVPLGTWDVGSDRLGQWQLGVHHHFDPNGQVLYLGSGERVETSAIGPVVASRWRRPLNDAQTPTPLHTAVLADGSIYFAGYLGTAIFRVLSDGTLSVAAGDVNERAMVDASGSAARFEGITALTHDDDGNLYIADGISEDLTRGRVRKMSVDGRVSTLFGGGAAPDSHEPFEGAAAALGFIGAPWSLALRADGSFVFYELNSARLWEVRESAGAMRLFALSADMPPTGEDGPLAERGLGTLNGISAAANGELYVSEVQSGHLLLRRIAPSGEITTLAGGGSQQPFDGSPARDARISSFHGGRPALGSDGSVYFTSSGGTLSRVLQDGTLRTSFGASFSPTCSNAPEEGTPAKLASCDVSAFDFLPDGSIIAAGTGGLSRLSPLDRWSRDAANIVPSADGSEVYTFDIYGRHLETKDALSGATRFRFTYADGLLVQIVDRNGLTTRIERGANGDATAIIGPYGERTELTIDADGDLRSVRSPAAESFSLGYANHLLTSLQTPRGGLHSYGYL